MRRLRLIYSRLYGLLCKSRVEREMEEELRFHLRMRSALNREAGLPPEEARGQAAKSFGNLSVIMERCRDIKGGGLVETILSDLRYGARMLAKSPIFTAVAVLTLGLGVGANSAIFSLVNGVLLRPLPFDGADKLVRVYTKNDAGL